MAMSQRQLSVVSNQLKEIHARLECGRTGRLKKKQLFDLQKTVIEAVGHLTHPQAGRLEQQQQITILQSCVDTLRGDSRPDPIHTGNK